MWIDDDLIFPMEKTFGQLVKEGYKLPPNYAFYNEANRSDFEKKFYRHFKYNRIGYDSTEMFTDMFEDILELNYPKYKHYFDTLEKAKTLKWWNNKDFITEFSRVLDKQEGTTFLSTIEKLDKMTKTLDKTGTVSDKYDRALQEKTVEKGRTQETNETAKSGSNTVDMTKGTTIEETFTRNLASTEVKHTSDNRDETRTSESDTDNNSTTNNSSESQNNSTTKNLDTPQGTINNLIDNVNAYMTTATVDSSRDIEQSNSNTTGTSHATSKDVTGSKANGTNDTQGTETGTTSNTTATSGSDVKTETLGEKLNSTIDNTKANDVTLDKTGHATDVKTYGTKDTTTRIVTDKDTTNSNEEMTGQDNETYTKKEEGNIGVTSAGQLVNDWLKWGYITLDKMIIRDCEKLFLQVY